LTGGSGEGIEGLEGRVEGFGRPYQGLGRGILGVDMEGFEGSADLLGIKGGLVGEGSDELRVVGIEGLDGWC